MKEVIKLGRYGLDMGYFSQDDLFHPEAKNLMDAYEVLCEKAFWQMKYAMCDDQSRKEVICFCAGVKALHSALSMYAIDEPDTKPDFGSLLEFARKVKSLNFLPVEK